MKGPLLATLAALAGCYQVGVQPVEDARGIAVPTFQNATLRRDVEVSLTRHVRREVLEATPLHLQREGEAALVLRGAVAQVDEAVLIAGSAQEVVHAGVTVSASFAVYDRAGRMVAGEDADADGRPDAPFTRLAYAEFTTPRGETREDAVEEALRDLAELIVQELTARSDDRFEPNDEAAAAAPLPAGRQVALVQRDDDWFRVEVPPGLALHATLFAPEGPRWGLEVEGAVAAQDGRGLRLPAAATQRTARLRVRGDDAGRSYQLLLRLLPE